MWSIFAKKQGKGVYDDIEHEQLRTLIIHTQNDLQAHLTDLNFTLQALNAKVSMREKRSKKSHASFDEQLDLEAGAIVTDENWRR